MVQPSPHDLRLTLLAVASIVASVAAVGQERTPHPEKWRPIAYRDLQMPGPQDRLYVDLWADVIQLNNHRYLAAGDRRYGIGNAPVREAHVVVRGGDKAALLSILDTAADCAAVADDPAGGVSVKMCPMRLALWNGGQVSIRQAKGCYLEPRAKERSFTTTDPSYAASYAAYDIATKSFRLGVILAHRAVERCSQTVPLYPK
ncbi:hypothetical protein [Methylocystis iwaonis]|uniref:hypothetical protein n=1 Tax=Methylocystis iwaonis TaxID=2885079 RepID=UPI002E7B32B3|nr:hypothetical protein [Methylocystis iwaonis]